MLAAQHERNLQREFDRQPGEVKEAMAAAGGAAVAPVTAPAGGGVPGALGAASGTEGCVTVKESPATGTGDEPTTAAGRMGGGVAAPEVPNRMRDVLPEGEIEAGGLDRPVTKMNAAAKQKEETAQFGGV
ncbi:hypothetical protein CLOM_g23449 [Closterium sp. NIES-68]|nr:hypothetical protein CLOM_g23449 [Closterium sp. NIES-68]GJP72083.1 hypothetical protein CLOP_g2851 [Closterium sp. NIES-67]